MLGSSKYLCYSVPNKRMSMSVQEMREVFVKDVLQDLDGYTQVVRTANNVGGYCALLGILRQLAEFADLRTAGSVVRKIAEAAAEGR